MSDLRTRISALFIPAAAVLLIIVGVRASRIEPLSLAATATEASAFTDAAVHRRALTESGALELAAEQNPFHPERRRGGVFRLPEEDDPASMVDDAALRSQSPVSLVGTAVSDNGGDFVVCAVGAEPPRIVRLGGACGDLELEAVERGKAEFVDAAGERVVLEVPEVESP